MIRSKIQRLQDDLAEWSDTAFGVGRSPSAPIAHLCKEVIELAESPCDVTEAADCLMLLLDINRMAGRTADILLEACFDKLEVNKGREWGEPDEYGVVEHIRETVND